MKPARTFIYILLLLYHIVAVAVALNLNPTLADNLVNNASLVRIITIFGLLAFLVVYALTLYNRRLYHKRISRLEAEKNEIKAQVFDMKRREEELDREIKSFESSISKSETPPKRNIDPDQTTL
uniref:DUF1049 domain-containing protein n=1 Tax=Roseihalotalea indica TaxID=2867963 RepID=A0AA49GMH7_9BACT|nr:hypothetical protein K4G66_02500 [Tunicatimonas sp. TK19036]